LAGLPLLASERTTSPLPEHQPSELFLSVIRVALGYGRGVRTGFASAATIQGGIAIQGKLFYEMAVVDHTSSSVTRSLSEEQMRVSSDALVSNERGREFIRLNLRHDDELPTAQGQDSIQPVAPASPPPPLYANARDDEPSPEAIKAFAFTYMRQLSQQKLSDREIAGQLASTIISLEKVQLICPSYFYINTRRARFDYLLRQGTWAMMFGPGKTSTSIMNDASAKRNQEVNNSVSKKEWCDGIKAFGIETLGWGPLFEVDR
jgi:hypothetical protein